MPRSLLSSISRGIVLDVVSVAGTDGLVRVIEDLPASIDTSVYVGPTGGTTVAAPDLKCNALGELPGYVEDGTWLLTVMGITRQIEALSGVLREEVDDLAATVAAFTAVYAGRWFATPTASPSSDSSGWNAALADAVSAGGDQINLRNGTYMFDDTAGAVPDACSVVGPGPGAAVILLTTSGSRLKFADGGHGVSGGFSVHGGTDAARLAEVCVEVGITNQQRLVDIEASFSTDDTILLNGTQNAMLECVRAYHNNGNGTVFDNGASSNRLDDGGGSNNLGYDLVWRQTIPGGVALNPSFNVVTGGVFERPFKAGGLTASGLISASAGYNNEIIGATLSHATSDGLSVAAALSAIKLTNDAILFLADPIFIGDTTYSTFADVRDSARLYLTGRIAPTGALVGIKSELTTLVFLRGTYEPISVGTPLDLTGYIQCDSYPIPVAKAMPGFVFIDDADGKLKFREGTVGSPGTVQPLY